MTNTEPTDTRPRCGGRLGSPQLVGDRLGLTADVCKGCADCDQPAPTPSGDAAHTIEDDNGACPVCRAVLGFEEEHSKSCAEDARDEVGRLRAALQEARRDKANAEAWNVEAARVLKEERKRRMAAEQRLREVEEERDRLLAALLTAAIPLEVLFEADDIPGIAPSMYEGIAEAVMEIRSIHDTAASRPVPATRDPRLDPIGPSPQQHMDAVRAAAEATAEQLQEEWKAATPREEQD